ncbi:type IV secretion protein Rhs [Streptosporangiaceae bacterium NEAU-GS5]|nr:type IV secretion protein Rhs [Streptosporangiaceae bacterium NEAU-GS5]
MSMFRVRGTAVAIAAALALGLPSVTQQPAEAATGPSVDLPAIPSVPVDQQSMSARPPDQAMNAALHGDQPVSAGAKAGGGTPTATTLAASASWNVSGQLGDFHWSYPLRMPPSPGGLDPELALSYSSSAVDGQTSVTNNQSSWAGTGWDLSPGFVERTYGGCSDDKDAQGHAPQTGDLCWRSWNATASTKAGGGMLIGNGIGRYHPKNDDGSRVELLSGAGNGDDDGEYWKITTTDGTQYFYGSRPDAHSAWTVPVFGDDDGEPCHHATYAASGCAQAWRWNLDKVVDTHGNTILYGYDAEPGTYGMNMADTATSYTRGGTLRTIEYGLRPGVATAAARVDFAVADRCVPGSNCVTSAPDNWPDTPLSERCAATCANHHSPTFWTTKRLSTVTTSVWRGGAYAPVDRWTLDHQYPSSGSGDKPALWLHSITHTGLAGGQIDLPSVTFEGTQKANRVLQDGTVSPIVRYRLTGIVSESGGVISVTYADPDCGPGAMPAAPQNNTQRCFPVRWTPTAGAAERTDWFHKYVVASVTTSDRIGGNLDEKVSYEYLDGAAWHLDTSEFTPADKRTWNEFRGYSRVRVHTGRTSDPAGPVGMTEQRFYRGMGATVPDSEGAAHQDPDWLNGFLLEDATFDGESGDVVTKTINEPAVAGPTATRGDFKAYQVRTGTEQTYSPLAAGGKRVTKAVTTYNADGLPETVSDLGDTAAATDDLCSRTTYARNADAWIVSLPSREETWSVACSGTPEFPRDAVSDQLTAYDGQEVGAAPTKGDVTTVKVLKDHPASGPVYAVSSTAAYDDYGRATESSDALGRRTATAFSPATGPITAMTVTDPKGFATTTELEPAFGVPLKVTDVNDNVTETAYDALGRAVKVWQPDRPRADYPDSPSCTFIYQMSQDAPTAVTTSRIGANGHYVTGTTVYDGLLRARQRQEPAAGGGRLITDIRYDTHGRAYKVTQPYFNDAAVDAKLWEAADAEIPSHTLTRFDGADRAVAAIVMAGSTEKWRTTTTYDGERVSVDPPGGGTATTTVTDARGQTVELDQYRGGQPSGAADTTRYAYTPEGDLAALTDPAGNVWRYGHDLRGRVTSTNDPDKGLVTATYDDAGQVTTRTDARGKVLAYDYDEDGRPLSMREGSATGRLLTQWTYDTVPWGVGRPATTTSYDADGNAYVSRVLAYTALYQPAATSITVPAVSGLAEEPVAGTYRTSFVYNPDGSVASETYPALGDPLATGLYAETVLHTYDEAGRPLTTSGGPDGSTVEYASQTSYTRYGEQQRVQLGAGTKRAWLSSYYDPDLRRLDRYIVDAEVAHPMQTDLRYGYDAAGNVTSVADRTLDRTADTQCFHYDYLRRLTDAWTPGGDCEADPSAAALGGPAPYWQSFTYDLIGNRRSQTLHATSGDTTKSYAYPISGDGVARPHAVTDFAAQTYAYDAAGNTTTRGAQRLTWDTQGHLESLTDGGGTTRFAYDAAGQRLLRHDTTGTTVYLGNQEIRFDRAAGAVTGTRYYVHGGQTVAVRTRAGLSWLGSDAHGTAVTAIDASTEAVSIRRLDPFGNARGTQPAAWPGDKGFVGGTGDPSGLIQLGAREYDPLQGRFLSVDPVIDTNDPQQLNAYAYGNNSPATFSDPSGLRFDCGQGDGCAYNGEAWTSNPAKAQVYQQRAYARIVAARKARAAATKRAWNHDRASQDGARDAGYYRWLHREQHHDFGSGADPHEYTKPAAPEPKEDDGCHGFWGCVGRGLSNVGHGIVKGAEAVGKAANYVYNNWGTVLSVAGFAVCIVSTGGACAVAGALTIGLSAIANTYDCVSNPSIGRCAADALHIGVDVAGVKLAGPGLRRPVTNPVTGAKIDYDAAKGLSYMRNAVATQNLVGVGRQTMGWMMASLWSNSTGSLWRLPFTASL